LADGDRFGLRLSQPLRIDGGGFAMSLPTSFDYASMAPGYSIVRSSLVPRGRELDAELSYGRRWLGNGWISGNLFTRRQPGHFQSAAPDNRRRGPVFPRFLKRFNAPAMPAC
jgi:hypothetical protein